VRRLVFSLKAVSKRAADRKHQLGRVQTRQAPGRVSHGGGDSRQQSASLAWPRSFQGRTRGGGGGSAAALVVVVVGEEADCGGLWAVALWAQMVEQAEGPEQRQCEKAGVKGRCVGAAGDRGDDGCGSGLKDKSSKSSSSSGPMLFAPWARRSPAAAYLQREAPVQSTDEAPTEAGQSFTLSPLCNPLAALGAPPQA